MPTVLIAILDASMLSLKQAPFLEHHMTMHQALREEADIKTALITHARMASMNTTSGYSSPHSQRLVNEFSPNFYSQ